MLVVLQLFVSFVLRSKYASHWEIFLDSLWNHASSSWILRKILNKKLAFLSMLGALPWLNLLIAFQDSVVLMSKYFWFSIFLYSSCCCIIHVASSMYLSPFLLCIVYVGSEATAYIHWLISLEVIDSLTLPLVFPIASPMSQITFLYKSCSMELLLFFSNRRFCQDFTPLLDVY